jgi:hypothetical protein
MVELKVDFKIAGEAHVPEILAMMEQFNAIYNYPFEREKTQKNLVEFLANPNLGRTWVIKN